jgi:hypothetical protein
MSLGMPGSQGSGAGWRHGFCWQRRACSSTYSEGRNPWRWTNGAVGSNHCVGRDGKSGIHQHFNSQDLLCLMAMTVWARGGESDESHLGGWGQKNYRDVLITCLTKKKSLCDCILKLSLQPD